MNPINCLLEKTNGLIVPTLLLSLLTFAPLHSYTSNAQTYTGSGVLPKDGTYTGSREHSNTIVPAVEISASEPVVIAEAGISISPTIGKITREFWAGVTGTRVSAIPVSRSATSTGELTSFEAPSNAGDYYGQRIRGYVTAPRSGEYTFWLASDDAGELWLSTSEDPARKVKIASVSGWTSPRQWGKYASQQSARVTLEAGRRYYIEALHLEVGGGDNLAVGWQLPNGDMERPIAGNRLSPAGSIAPVAPALEPAPAALAPAGKITREFWAGVTGTRVSAIPVSRSATSTGELTSFEAPSNAGDYYGQRIRGYVTAPRSGEYTFWLASDDAGELWLSTSEDPARKVKIASVSGWTSPRQWGKYASQQSARVTLEAGRRYYIEALHLEVGGGDNLAVGWQLPNGDLERPIAGNRLSPYSNALLSSSMQGASTLEGETSFSQITAFPNPFSDVITLHMGSLQAELKEVVLLDQTGRILYKHQDLTLDNNRLSLNLSDARLASGLYFLRYTDAEGSSRSLKVIKQ